jgi:hypothetical protein
MPMTSDQSNCRSSFAKMGRYSLFYIRQQVHLAHPNFSPQDLGMLAISGADPAMRFHG